MIEKIYIYSQILKEYHKERERCLVEGNDKKGDLMGQWARERVLARDDRGRC